MLQELVHGHTSMAVDYSKELEEWASSDYYDEHVHKIQLPYAQVTLATLKFIYKVHVTCKKKKMEKLKGLSIILKVNIFKLKLAYMVMLFLKQLI